MFLARIFFWGGALPEFLESVYKIDTGSDHVAKFRGNRPRELGDNALKKKKTSRAFYKTSRTHVPGGLIINESEKLQVRNQNLLEIHVWCKITSVSSNFAKWKLV